MPWETRGNKRYYYRKQRIGDKVISIYVGNGVIAEWLTFEDQRKRERIAVERQIWNEEKAKVKALDDELDQAEELVRTMTRAILLDAGFHLHKGQWRKRRDNDTICSLC